LNRTLPRADDGTSPSQSEGAVPNSVNEVMGREDGTESVLKSSISLQIAGHKFKAYFNGVLGCSNVATCCSFANTAVLPCDTLACADAVEVGRKTRAAIPKPADESAWRSSSM
jgi:hypothetical protein